MNLGTIVQKALLAVPADLRTRVTFGRIVPGTLDPATDTRTDMTRETFSAPVVVVAPKADAGQPVDEDLRELLVAADDCDFRPRAGHYVTNLAPDTGIEWRVISALPVGPTGVAALYTVTVTR